MSQLLYSLSYLVIFKLSFIESLIDCDNVLSDTNEFTGECSNKWKNLKPLVRPGQAVVGYAWVRRKVDNHFGSEDDAQDYMDENPIIGVINPGIVGSPLITIVDKHHTLSALDYSGFVEVSVTFNIICDYRNLSWQDFFQVAEAQNLLYLGERPKADFNALPQPISAQELPMYFEFTKSNKAFADDPWRALSSYSRKVKDAPDGFPNCDKDDDKYCERCYDRVCETNQSTVVHNLESSPPPSIPFYEFRWGYFMNFAAFFNSSYWPSFDDWHDFMKAYSQLDTSFETMDYKDWQDVADLLIPLCRSTPTGSYSLPDDIFPASNSLKLPGYVEGTEKLGADPTCGIPSC